MPPFVSLRRREADHPASRPGPFGDNEFAIIEALVEEVPEITARGKTILNGKADETKSLASTAWASGKSGWFGAHEHASLEALEAAQVFCEARAFQALVQFRNKEHMRGSVNVRTAATSYFQLVEAIRRHPIASPFLEALERGDVESLKLREQDARGRRMYEVVSAVLSGVAIFRFFSSLIPPSFQWIAKALGFQIDRASGLAHIRGVAQTVLTWSPKRPDAEIDAALAAAAAGGETVADAGTADAGGAASASASSAVPAAGSALGRPPKSSTEVAPFKDADLIPPRAPMAALLSAWIECFQTEQFDQCDEILAACLRIFPRGGMFSYLGGYLARRAGDMSLAIRLFDHALGALTGHFEHATQGCLYEKAQCMMLTGSWSDAAAMYRVFLDGYRGKNYVACAWQELGYCLHALGKPAEAAEAMAKAPPRVRDHYTFDRFNGRRGTEYCERGGISRASWLAMGAWYLFRGGRPGDAMAFCVRCAEILDSLSGVGTAGGPASWLEHVLSTADPAVASPDGGEPVPPSNDDDIVSCEGADDFVTGCAAMPEWAKRDADADLAKGKAMLVPGSSAYSSQLVLDKVFVRDAGAMMLLARGRALASLAAAEVGHPARNAKSARSAVTRQMAFELEHGPAAKHAAPKAGTGGAGELDILLVASKVDAGALLARSRACLAYAAALGASTPELWVEPHAHYFYATTYSPAPGADPSKADSAAAKGYIAKAMTHSKYDFDKPLFRSLSALEERF